MYFLLTFLAGVILILAPLLLARFFRNRWHFPKNFFWTAGLWYLIIGTIYFSLIAKLDLIFPNMEASSMLLQAFIFGLLSGLFFELGRFVVLDKAMKNVRSFQQGVYFGIGWAGVSIFLTGILLILQSFSMYFLVQTSNFQAQFPEATSEQIQFFEESRKQALELTKQNPITALSPLVENSVFMVVDITMSLLVVLALLRGQTSLVWGAVFFRTLVEGSSFYLTDKNMLLAEIVLVVFGIVAFVIIKMLGRLFYFQSQ